MIVALLVAPGRHAAAQDAEVRGLDEAAFVAAVEAADPRLARLAAEVDVAGAAVVAEGVRPNPSVSIDREEVFPEGGLATHYARVVWPLDLSGRRGRRVAAARVEVDAVAADADAARLAVTLDALRVFYEAAHARLEVAALRGERDTLTRVVDVVRKRAGAGASSGYDVRRFELELAAFDDELATAETRLFELRARLAALAGQPDALLDATSALELPAPASADDDVGLEGRADLRAARLRAEGAERRAGAAARGWIPDFGLSAGVMTSDTGDETAFGYVVGLSFTLPVYDKGQADAAAARAARRLAEADARVIEVQAPAEVRTRRAVLRRRIDQATTITTAQLAQLEGLLRSAETAYREGEGSVVELLDAYQTARDTRLRELELRLAARLAELDLWQALGRRP